MPDILVHPVIALRTSSHDEKEGKLNDMIAELKDLLASDEEQKEDEFLMEMNTMLLLGDACRVSHPRLYDEFLELVQETCDKHYRHIAGSVA